jgi:hypothetical protein
MESSSRLFLFRDAAQGVFSVQCKVVRVQREHEGKA